MHWLIYKSSRYRVAYSVDGLILGMFVAVLLDVVTTHLLISLQLGFEMNPVLAPLLRYSLVWIPVYLLSFPLIVPLLPETPRRAFGFYFLATGLLFGLNNLSGIIFQNYFVIDTVGFWIPEAFCVIGALAYFVYKIYQNSENRSVQIMTGVGCIGAFLIIEGAFYLLGNYLQQSFQHSCFSP